VSSLQARVAHDAGSTTLTTKRAAARQLFKLLERYDPAQGKPAIVV
jgi:hypothetical protein